MHTVYVKNSEDIDYALKRLKIKMDIDNVIDDVRCHRYFENTGQKRKRKARALDRKRKLGR